MRDNRKKSNATKGKLSFDGKSIRTSLNNFHAFS
jgi:hypothetical protein